MVCGREQLFRIQFLGTVYNDYSQVCAHDLDEYSQNAIAFFHENRNKCDQKWKSKEIRAFCR